MALFDFLKTKKNTASIAKERLRIIVAQERSSRGAPDYLPLLQRELLEVIRNALLMAGIDSNWQGAFVGAFIVLAVLLGMQSGGKSIFAAAWDRLRGR